MHSTETVSQFKLLRIRGFSLTKITKKLDISYSTAWEWDQKHRPEVEQSRAYFIEYLKERFLPDCAELMSSLNREVKRVTAELDKRDYSKEPTWVLINRQNMLLSRIDKVCANPPLLLLREFPEEKPIQNHIVSNTDPQGGPPVDVSTRSVSPPKETDPPNPSSAPAPELNGKPYQNHIISDINPQGGLQTDMPPHETPPLNPPSALGPNGKPTQNHIISDTHPQGGPPTDVSARPEFPLSKEEIQASIQQLQEAGLLPRQEAQLEQLKQKIRAERGRP
jgi:hypothetical protein